MTNCTYCKSEVQPNWKACPQCGSKVQGEQGSSFDITDSSVLLKQTDESQTVDRSVNVGGDVSGTVNVGETVNVSNVINNVINLESPNIQGINLEEVKEFITGELAAALQGVGIRYAPVTGKPKGLTHEQSKIATAVRKKVEETGQQFGSAVVDPKIYTLLGNAALMSGDKEQASQDYDEFIRLSLLRPHVIEGSYGYIKHRGTPDEFVSLTTPHNLAGGAYGLAIGLGICNILGQVNSIGYALLRRAYGEQWATNRHVFSGPDDLYVVIKRAGIEALMKIHNIGPDPAYRADLVLKAARGLSGFPLEREHMPEDWDWDELTSLLRQYPLASTYGKRYSPPKLQTSTSRIDSPMAGVRNEGLLSTHEIGVWLKERRDITEVKAKSAAALTKTGLQLVMSLGFEVSPLPGPASVLISQSQKLAIAVFLDRGESPDTANQRFSNFSPATYALTKADQENLPYVIIANGPALRIYPTNPGVGVGRRGRTETFLELHLNLLKKDHIPLLWYLFSADALGADGTFEKLLGDSKDYATSLGERLESHT